MYIHDMYIIAEIHRCHHQEIININIIIKMIICIVIDNKYTVNFNNKNYTINDQN